MGDALQRRTWSTGGKEAGDELAVFTCSPESQSYPGLHQKPCGLQGEGGDSHHLLHSHEIPPGELHQLWGSQHKKHTELLESRGSHKDDQRVAASPMKTG